MLLRLEKFG